MGQKDLQGSPEKLQRILEYQDTRTLSPASPVGLHDRIRIISSPARSGSRFKASHRVQRQGLREDSPPILSHRSGADGPGKRRSHVRAQRVLGRPRSGCGAQGIRDQRMRHSGCLGSRGLDKQPPGQPPGASPWVPGREATIQALVYWPMQSQDRKKGRPFRDGLACCSIR
jgi:hypothetical protein